MEKLLQETPSRRESFWRNVRNKLRWLLRMHPKNKKNVFYVLATQFKRCAFQYPETWVTLDYKFYRDNRTE